MVLLHRFTSEQIKEIEVAYKSASDRRVADRLYILLLRANGKSLENIAKKTNISQPTISRLIKRYSDIGLAAIIRELKNQKEVVKREFTDEQVSELKTAFSGATNLRDRYRLQALLLRAKGLSVKETSELTGYSPTHVSYIEKNFLDNGLADVLVRKKVKQKSQEIKYQFTGAQKVEIEAACKTVKNKRIAVRLEALRLRCYGEKIDKIVEETGASKSTVMRTIAKYSKDGLESVIRWRRNRRKV